MALLFFGIIGLTVPRISIFGDPSVPTKYISLPGNVTLGGLFPIHKQGEKENLCGDFNEIPGYQYMEAMLYALRKINQRQDLLPGIKLGTVIYDTCLSPTISADRTKDLIKITLTRTNVNDSEFAGVIGPFTSGNTERVASFLRVYEIPQIGYGSLTVGLSNKDYYDYFFRTVPPDSYFAPALAELLKRLGWNYVSIIYSKGTYSETGTQQVIKALEKQDICVAKKIRLPRFPEERDFDKAIVETASVKEVNIVVAVTIQRDSRGLLKAKARQPLAERLSFVGSVSWSNRDDITKGLEHVAEGTITFGHLDGDVPGFEAHFRSLNLSNYNSNYKGWFETFWQKQFNCSLGSANYSRNCTGRESLLTQHMEFAPVRVVINAVNAMAHALHNMQQNLCPNVSGLCQKMKPLSRTRLRKFLANVTFLDSSFHWPITFDQNHEVEGNYTVLNFQKTKHDFYSFVPLGNWTGQFLENGEISGKLHVAFPRMRWLNGSTTIPLSVCSAECDNKSVKRTRPGFPRTCCWDCSNCQKYDVILNNECLPCPAGQIPDKNLSTCLKPKLKYINMDTPLAVFFLFCAFTGNFANVTVFIIFFMNRQHPLITASNREMCYSIFLGIFLVFMIPFAFLVKPTQRLCYGRRFLMGISFVICYAALFMKVRRMYWVFRRDIRTPRSWEPNFIGLKSQLLISFGLIALETFLCVVLSKRNKLKVVENFYPENEELFLECSVSPPAFVAYLACALVLMFACTTYAFLGRNIQKNFREMMQISITMYISNAIWVAFIACFLNVEKSFSRVYLTSGISVFIGWITLVGVFAPKLYHLYTKTVIDENAIINWRMSLGQANVEEKAIELNLKSTPNQSQRRLDTIKECNEERGSREYNHQAQD